MDQKKLAWVALALGAVALLFVVVGPPPWATDSRSSAVAGPEEPPVEAPPAPKEKAAPGASAKRGPAPKAKPTLPIDVAQLDWYGIYMEGNKVGWARIEVEPVERAGKTFIRTHYRVELSMRAMGTTKKMAIEEEQLFAAASPHRVVTGWNLQKQGAFSQRVQLQGTAGAFTALITAGGQTRKLQLKEDPVTFLESMRAYHWFREPRKVGEKLTYRTFDLGELEHDDDQLTVKSVEKAVVDGVPLTYYVAEHRSKKDGSTGTMRVDSTGRLLSMQMMGVMEVRLEPEHIAKQKGKVVDIFVSRLAKIDKPLGKQADVVDLVIEVRGTGIDRIRDGPRQRASYDAERKVLTLKLGAKHDPKVKATEAEIRDALAEDADHPIKNERILKLAQGAIGDAKTPREKVDRLVKFVDKYIEDSYAAEPLSVIDILNTRKGDCTEHSALFATLARAVGVPAREVGGLMYIGDEIRVGGSYGFGGHMWNEVVLDGVWVPVDATWGQTELDATHIRQAADGKNEAANFALGGAQLKLISIQRKK